MALSVAVVAHVARTEQAKRLTDDLGAELFMDDGSLTEWPNHRRALEWGASQPGHLCILQDDAVPIDDFLEHANRAATERPDDMIGLYVGRQRPYQTAVIRAVKTAEAERASWLSASGLWWGVATVLPTVTIPALLAACDAKTSMYDVRLGRTWAQTQRRPVLYTWPSLVDHDDGPSVIHGRTSRQPGRVAHRVGVPNWSARTVQV